MPVLDHRSLEKWLVVNNKWPFDLLIMWLLRFVMVCMRLFEGVRKNRSLWGSFFFFFFFYE